MERVIKNSIERKIVGEQLIAKQMLEMLPALKNVFEAFNGKKCFKVDGTKTKQFQDALKNALDGIHNVKGKRVFLNTQYQSGYMSFSNWIAWETFPNDERKSTDGSYAEYDFYICKRENQTLIMSDEWEEETIAQCEKMINTSFEDVSKKLSEIKILIKQAELINNSIPYYARLTLPYVG